MNLPGRSAVTSSEDGLLKKLAIIAIPALIFIEGRLIGRMFLTEILLLALLPFLSLKRGRQLSAKLPKTLLILGVLWLAAQIATDVLRETPFQDWSRGWAKIVFFLLNFSALYLLLNGDRQRILLFFTGIAVGHLMAYVFHPSEYALERPWKFGYGWSVTLLAMGAASLARVRRYLALQLAMLAVIGIANLILGSRSTFVFCILVAGYMFLSRRYHRMPDRHRLQSDKHIWPMVLVSLILLFAAAKGYEYAALDGLLGEEAQEKYEFQSRGEYGLMLGGRHEILASGQAILDSPILGHGSWAKNQKYRDILEERLMMLGYEKPRYRRGVEPLIPSHSYLLGAWVESGVFGAIFWGVVLSITIKALLSLYKLREPLLPIFSYVAITYSWNVLFSGFGAQERIHAAFFLCMMLFVLSETRRVRTRTAYQMTRRQ